MKYTYPAIFEPDDGGWCIFFPDIGYGATQGDDITEGLEMAHDFLENALVMLEKENKQPPQPSQISDLTLENGSFANFITAEINPKYVRKTLTIPFWLNVAAKQANINFSQTLQNALKTELQIQE
ncbi:MAG: type II toxin-antitoxin system HicB family antitoxin [Turicibacter sp.]|nr:type II toxin-antitoxin system HicB family antitoxin [Turicibacter sp.]